MMNALRIMIVDDEEAIRESLAAWLNKGGYEVTQATRGAEALEILSLREHDLVLLDIKMPGMDGHELLRRIRENNPLIMIVMITAYGSIESAVLAMKEGANDYLLKPFDPEHLMLLIQKMARQKEMMDEYHIVKSRLSEMEAAGFEDLIGRSPAMLDVFGLIEEVAQTETPVLITGETGTGKELVARAIHSRSRRNYGPFIAINCGAMPEHLLESELFGHERGAFTGAVKTRLGRLEMADQGTLFLDEVGEISTQMQVNLLRALEEKRFLRLGGSREVESNFRLICATHRDLTTLMEGGRVRSDFYYRINVISIQVPPLRARNEDIALLANHFVNKYSKELGKTIEGLTLAAYRVLERYDWPGNVRELRNVIERAVVLSGGGMIDADGLTFIRSEAETWPKNASLEEVEKQHIRSILEECHGNLSWAADRLGVHRGTLARKIKKYGLTKPN
ncbi:MAG: sigma-54 dependent transcriptional regulator [Thermodesulfobacteriota bacterium]